MKNMRYNAVIVDISCNHQLEVETSHPTTLENPIYYEEGIMHYVVDHTPALLFQIASESISKAIIKYLDT